jgi:hypothetical protein
LTVTVHESDIIELFANRVMKTDFLISAITLVHRVEQHGDREGRFLYLASPLERPVGRGIVNDQNSRVICGQRGRNPPENILYSPFGVIRHDENEDSNTHLIALIVHALSRRRHAQEYMESVASVPLLLIDDFGKRKLPHTSAEDLLEIVTRRPHPRLRRRFG